MVRLRLRRDGLKLARAESALTFSASLSSIHLLCNLFLHEEEEVEEEEEDRDDDDHDADDST